MIKYLIFFCFFSMVYSNDQNHLEIKPEPSISPKLLSVSDNKIQTRKVVFAK